MRFCNEEDIEFVIAGDKYDIILQTILKIKEELWEELSSFQPKKKKREEVSEGVHFVGPEKGGAAYRFVVVRKSESVQETR